MFEDILLINKNDYIKYELKDIEEIKKQDEYKGYRVKILCELDNIRQIVPLDIATGDILTYQAVEYEYKTVFLEDNIRIQAYNLETMLVEKLQTIYSKGFLNSRNKDFYDVYLLYKLKSDEIDFEKLAAACERTFEHRKTKLDFLEFKEILNIMASDKGFNDRWDLYVKKNDYVKDISFNNIIENIVLLIEKIA